MLYGEVVAAAAVLTRNDRPAKLAPLCPPANDPIRHLQRRLAATHYRIGCIDVSFFVTMESPSTRQAPDRPCLLRWRAALKVMSPCGARPASFTETSLSTIS